MTTRDWILRGLAGSCISRHTLYGWYVDHCNPHTYRSDFTHEMDAAEKDGLVYVQREVPCYEHTNGYDFEPGWALTDAGNVVERKARA